MLPSRQAVAMRGGGDDGDGAEALRQSRSQTEAKSLPKASCQAAEWTALDISTVSSLQSFLGPLEVGKAQNRWQQ